MAGKKGTKLEVIRLKREDEQTRKPTVRRAPAVRKLVIRLLPAISEHLRREMRYRGDLSAMVIEALSSVDLKTVGIVDLATDARMSTTTIALPPQLHSQIKAVAKSRNASMNEIVNTAVAHWLAGKKIIRLS